MSDTLLLKLEQARPSVRRMVEYLVSSNATARLLGLDAIGGHLLQRGAPAAAAPDALPFLLALGTDPRYPHAAAVLTRVAVALDSLDHPPRATAGERAALGADPATAGAWRLLEANLPALLRVAGRSRDPEAARAAARIAFHFPAADRELTPMLIALMSGVRDAPGRAALLYALASVHPLEPCPPAHVRRALEARGPTPDKAAVALALARRPLPEALRDAVARALAEIADVPEIARGWPDPRAWGSQLSPDAVASALHDLGVPR